MTKKELLILLADFDDDTEIYIDMFNDDQYETDNIWVSQVRLPNVSRYDRVCEMKIAQRACKETSDAKKCVIL